MVVKLQNCREVSQNQEFLIARLNEFINAIPKNSADDIYEAYTHRFDEIKKHDFGYIMYPCKCEGMNCVKDIYHLKNTEEFITTGAKELVVKVKAWYVEEVALFQLMTEGYIMPVGMGCGISKASFNLHFDHCNCVIDIYLDALPFKKYYVVKKP